MGQPGLLGEIFFLFKIHAGQPHRGRERWGVIEIERWGIIKKERWGDREIKTERGGREMGGRGEERDRERMRKREREKFFASCR